MKRAHALPITCFIIAGAGCVHPMMTVSGELAERATTHELESASDGGVKLAFGPYVVHSIEQDAVSSLTEANVLDRAYGYRFRFTGVKATDWTSRCDSKVTAIAGADGKVAGTGAVKLTCKIDDDSRDITKRWTLKLAGTEAGAGARFGELTSGKSRLRVQSVPSPEPGPSPIGYELTLRDRPIAAVQTLGDGRLWLHGDLGGRMRAAMVAASGALLLFERIVQDLPAD